MCRKFLYILTPICILFGVSYTYGSPLKAHAVYDFSKGIDTYHSSLSLPDGFVQDSNNVLFDSVAPITKRQGFSVAFSTKAYSFQQLWTYTDPTNTTWQIVRASDSIIANNLSGSASVLVATVSVNNLVGETNSQGFAFFVDQTNGVFYWNGSSTTYVSGSPFGSLITSFHGRIWVAGAAVPNGNQLYGSKYLDGTTWTPNVNPNDPVQLTVGLQDNFDNLTALYPYLDTLYTFKHYSTYSLYGFDQTNFQISIITNECGCIDQGSIQTYGGSLKFMSLRGVEDFNGYTCTRISDPIKNKIDNAIAGGTFSQQSWVQSSQQDWQAGTFTPSNNLSATLSPPSLVLSTFSATDTTTADFSSGTFSNTQSYNNSVFISTNNSGNITNPDFESSFSGNWIPSGSGHTWAQASSLTSSGCGNILPQSGSEMAIDADLNFSGSLFFEATDVNGNLLQQTPSLTSGGNHCSWTQSSLTPSSSNIGVRVKFRLHASRGGGSDSYLSTSDSYVWGGPISFYWNSGDGLNSGGLAFDNITFGSSTITSGNFTSRTFNTNITSPTVYTIADWTVNTSTPYFEVQSATASTGPWSYVTASTATNVKMNQYIRYISSFTVGSGDNALSSLDDVSFTATSSTGSIKSQIHTITSMNTWGNFSIQDALNGGNIVFSICSSTNSNMSPPESCANQTINSQILVSTGQASKNLYVQWYATFTVTAATQTPTLNSVTVQWFAGSRATPMSSTVWDNRYWLSVTTNTFDTTNDAIEVLNKNGAWSSFDIHAGGLTQYKGSLYHSDSNSTGNVYLDNQGYNDNGVAINAYIRSKDYCEGDPTTDDYYESLYVVEDNFGNFNTAITYIMDRDMTSPYTLSSVNQSEFQGNTAIKIPFVLSATNQNFGKCIDFIFNESDLGSPWQFYGFTSYQHPRAVQ